MTVEIINYNQGDVLDLTEGKSGEQEQIENTEAIGAEGGEQLPTDGQDGQVQDGSQGTGESSDTADGATTDGSSDDANAPSGEFFFGDEPVSVTVPDEVKDALTEAGVDEKTLLGELFAKGGKFELTEGTRSKLEAKFGKTAVNGYLNMYKSLNEQAAKDRAAAAETQAAQEAEYAKEYAELVGGKEGLEAIEAFVLESFDEKQLASYNAIMDTDNHAAHMLVLGQVKRSMELQKQLKVGDTDISLLGDNSASGTAKSDPADKGILTSEEYQTIMDGDKYWSDRAYMAKVDAARNEGIRKGV